MTGPFPLLFQCVFCDIDDPCSFSDFRAWYHGMVVAWIFKKNARNETVLSVHVDQVFLLK